MVLTEVVVSIPEVIIKIAGGDPEEERQEQPTLTMGSLRGKNLPPTGPDIIGMK